MSSKPANFRFLDKRCQLALLSGMMTLGWILIFIYWVTVVSMGSTGPNVIQQQFREATIEGIRMIPDPVVLSSVNNDSLLRSNSLASLTDKLNDLFSIPSLSKQERHIKLQHLLQNVDVAPEDLAKYVHFDSKYSYTRNLVTTDGVHYTLLILCWGAGKSSRIHNHPCDGCYVKVLSGALKETRYTIDNVNKEIVFNSESIAGPGAVTFMNDEIGLHKISNPSSDVGAISLHLYTPPFQSCKVWESAGKSLLSAFDAKMCSYSQFGFRNLLESDSNVMFYI